MMGRRETEESIIIDMNLEFAATTIAATYYDYRHQAPATLSTSTCMVAHQPQQAYHHVTHRVKIEQETKKQERAWLISELSYIIR